MNLSEFYQPQKSGVEGISRGATSHTFSRVLRYILVKGVTILITIFIGVFITVVLANRGGQIDKSVRDEIDTKKNQLFPGWSWNFASMSEETQAHIEQWQWDQEKAAGLHLPYWPRQFIWTIKALRLDWKALVNVEPAPGSLYYSKLATNVILTDLPHTLLLVGTAFLLLFLIGIPLALFLFRMQGSWWDHLTAMLAALTSVPSWVLGVLLVLIFSVELKILPFGGMYDAVPAMTVSGRMITIFRHLLLPVMAILFSLLFQCVYTWRTFFLLFAVEDYVELARAKGLPDRKIEQNYILRPTLPFILTNFTILLITFWQMTIALEKIFNWPGIGRLYLLTLPNFFGERIYPGVMQVTLGIVVLFAYILGITVFMLDIVYALMDPRIRIGDEGQTLRVVTSKRLRARFRLRSENRIASSDVSKHDQVQKTFHPPAPPQQVKLGLPDLVKTIKESLKVARSAFREILQYPSAVFGLVVIIILITGSLYAVIAYPYTQLGNAYYASSLTGEITIPRLAQPLWVNLFRRDRLPPTIILDSQNGTASKTVQPGSNGQSIITITYTFKYPYGSYPQDLILYFNSRYAVKRPFALLTWTRPDGKEFQVGSMGVTSSLNYTFLDGNTVTSILTKYPSFSKWFVDSGDYQTPGVDLLFSDLSANKPVVIPGTYTLRIKGVTFEDGSDLDAKMVLIGKVYGIAGTDYYRRNLLVPLLWGMPFALLFGLLGACVTTIFSMILAAFSAWYGGWVDNLIQRLVETNMILPIIGIAVLIYAYFNVSIWTLLGIVVLLNVFGSPTKSFRAAIMQVKDSQYIEAAKTYSASDSRIIFRYLVPRIIPTLIPQLVILIPSYVFLEATLGIFNIRSIYPTWGRVIYEALQYGENYGSSFWVLEPIGLLLLTGLAFVMLGFALERILNPKIR